MKRPCERSRIEHVGAFCVALLVVPLPVLIAGLSCGAPGGLILLSILPMGLGLLGLCFVVPWLEGRPRHIPRDELGRPMEIRQRILYLLLLSVLLPRVIFSHTVGDGAVVMVVWSGIGLELMRRISHPIPRAIVRRDRGARLRRWGGMVLEHLGRASITSGMRCASPWEFPMPSPPPAPRVSQPETPGAGGGGG